jgi:UDP-GlcNAc:undecaprenyl-phosphate GlcNAc-1-phosphate transferase
MSLFAVDQFSVLLLKSFVATLILLFLLRPFSIRFGWVDKPGGRKKHKFSVPLIGGWAIFLGFSLTFLPEIIHIRPYFVFWLAGLVLMIISGIDDRYTLRAGYRFILHLIVIAGITLFGQTSIVHLGNLLGFGVIALGAAGLFFTSFAVVGIINAVNMMDGMDGLTACVSLVELGLMLFLAVQKQFHLEAMIIVTFMGALIAFLFFNFPAKAIEKHKIFLGDTGSTLLGLLLAWLCMRLTQNTNGYPPALMLWLVALPLMDTLHLMINRKARGVPAFQADRRHIHHMLLQLDCSPKQITFLLSGSAFIIGTMGVMLYQYAVPETLLFWGMLVVFSAYSGFAYRIKKHVSQRKAFGRIEPDARSIQSSPVDEQHLTPDNS